MTIDERLDRLTARHEALTECIELMHRDWEERWKQISIALQQDGENIRALARIAKSASAGSRTSKAHRNNRSLSS